MISKYISRKIVNVTMLTHACIAKKHIKIIHEKTGKSNIPHSRLVALYVYTKRHYRP